MCNTSCLRTSLNKKFKNLDLICPLCKEEEESVEHFLFKCNKYSTERCSFIKEINTYIPYFPHLNFDEKIARLFCSSQDRVKNCFYTFCQTIYELTFLNVTLCMLCILYVTLTLWLVRLMLFRPINLKLKPKRGILVLD